MNIARTFTAHKMRFLLVTIAALAALTATTYYASRTNGFQAQADTASPTRERGLIARGRIEPLGRVIVVNAPGDTAVTIVRQLLVEQGTRVAVGDVLAIIDGHAVAKTELQVKERQLMLARRQFEQVRAGAKGADLAAQTAAVKARQSQLSNLQRQLDRNNRLVDGGFISSSALDSIETSRDQARSELENAQSLLKSMTEVRKIDEDVAAAQVTVAEAALAAARANLDRLIVRAPIAGEIISIAARSGDAIGPDGILRLADLSRLQVVAEVDESQIARVSEGARARITGSSLAEPIDARVTRLGAEVYRQKRPNSDILVGRDARIVEVEVTPEKALPRVLGAEVSVEISPRALR